MTQRTLIDAAIEHLRSHRIVFEPGLTDDEIARVEKAHGFVFPSDLQLFLQTALPVTGGFPNWRSESENDLRYRFLDRPGQGMLFDVEHNDFWPEEWGPRPSVLADALAEAGRRIEHVPRLIPVRSHHYLPASPSAEGNPIFAVRQTDITCVAHDLPSYLLGLFRAEEQASGLGERVVPFWTEVARTSHVHVPDLAGPAVTDTDEEYARLCKIVEHAGFWSEAIPGGVTFDRGEPTGERRHGVFWMARRDFGWLLCIRCPRYFFAPDAERIPDLCLALLNKLSHEDIYAGGLPFGNFRLDDEIRREFHLTTIHHFTNYDDDRERKLRSWEQLGWREMSHGQMDEAWKRYGQKFGYPEQRGGFTTPAHSTTWDIASIYLGKSKRLERLEADLTLKALAAMKKCTRPGEELLVLDWNHPCYFLDPHGGISDAQPSSWAVPVLPNGDHYIFLAQDHRFGIIGNCVDRTMCVFGKELVDAFAGSLPLIFKKPTWTYEERRAMECAWADKGWQRLTCDEKDDIWDRFNRQFDFYKRWENPESAGIIEPTPSLTWTIHREADRADLTLKILTAMRRATKPGDRLYALDAIHWYEHYTFDPHRLDSTDRDSWALPVYPDDNYTIFLAPDFRFGVFGNPLERTLCIFGKDLLAAMGNDLSVVLGRLVRKNGMEVVV